VGTSSSGAGAVYQLPEDPLHLRAGGEQQVSAVLGLVDQELVAEIRLLLFFQAQW